MSNAKKKNGFKLFQTPESTAQQPLLFTQNFHDFECVRISIVRIIFHQTLVDAVVFRFLQIGDDQSSGCFVKCRIVFMFFRYRRYYLDTALLKCGILYGRKSILFIQEKEKLIHSLQNYPFGEIISWQFPFKFQFGGPLSLNRAVQLQLSPLNAKIVRF